MDRKCNRQYYFSARTGRDDNPGTREAPFQTLFAAKRLSLKPGDSLLLERGSVFANQSLHLINCRGNAEAPVVIDCYGEGNKPVIEAAGGGLWYQDYGTQLDSPNHVNKGYVSSAVLLYDCEYIKISRLEITNTPELLGETYSQPDKMNRTGVAVVAQNAGTLHQIEMADLYIHDVKGNVYDKHLNNGGIYCTALKPESKEGAAARYDGLWIHHCVVEDCSRWGIAAGYSYAHAHFAGLYLDDRVMEQYGHTNVKIENNFVKNIGGDGITPMYCLRPLVQCNVSDNAATEINDRVYTQPGARGGKVAAAIWPWKCKDALFQYNEAYRTCENQDGQAWDADSGDGTIYQYNYSCQNGGGCVMFCEGESVNNIFRYNISVFDKSGVINPVNNPDAHIYGNIFVMEKDVPFIRHNMSGGHMLVEKNVICSIGLQEAFCDWHHQTDFAEYRGNLYCNFSKIPPEDKEGICENREVQYEREEGLCEPNRKCTN